MKKHHYTKLILGALAISVSSAMALPYAVVNTVGGFGPYQTGHGVEFTLEIGGATHGSDINAGTGIGSTWSLYDVKARNQIDGYQSNFQTFCIEGSEYLEANTSYTATSGSKTLYEYHDLTVGAAWLYWQFATGQLNGYNYLNNRKSSAGELQNTLWWLMGTRGYALPTSSPPNNIFTSLVKDKFGTGTGMFDSNADQYDVAVLRLWKNGDNGAESWSKKAQDVLVLTNPVPDSGLTVTLLGIAISGMVVLRRRIRPTVCNDC